MKKLLKTTQEKREGKTNSSDRKQQGKGQTEGCYSLNDKYEGKEKEGRR